ncbi:MAG TPA: glycosyltransferase [Candidatus Baltobacteraceae bacterium]|jgi:glycosyltransferase involved in cell wall biosynthesis
MRVAFITSHFPFDGKESFLCAELEQLAREFEVTIVPAVSAMRHNSFPRFERASRQTRPPFSIRTLGDAFQEFVRDPVAATRALWAVVCGPRSIRATFRNILIYPKALAVTRQLRAQGVNHIHAYWLSTPATIAYVASRLTGIPWSATGHRWDLVDSNISSLGRPRAGFLTTAAFVRTISEEGRRLVAGSFGSGGSPKIVVAHLGVRVSSLAPQRAAHGAHLRLACIASFVPVKGHAYMLAALQKVKREGIGFSCAMFGVGPLRDALARTIVKLDLGDCVEIVAQLPHAELVRKLAEGEFDVAILTSVDNGPKECEGIPVSLMEAMAVGIPVIATRSGSVGELVDDGNGILADPKDVDAIAAAVTALAADAGLRRTLGNRARARIAAGFNVEKTAAIVARLIAESAATSSYDYQRQDKRGNQDDRARA